MTLALTRSRVPTRSQVPTMSRSLPFVEPDVHEEPGVARTVGKNFKEPGLDKASAGVNIVTLPAPPL